MQAYLSPGQAPGMQGARSSTLSSLEEISERKRGGGRHLLDGCLHLFTQVSLSGHSPVREKQVFNDAPAQLLLRQRLCQATSPLRS